MTVETQLGGSDGRFATTHWTEVLKAGDPASRRDALEKLISAYWRPLYVFARRGGKPVEESKDLVQGFFARLVEKGGISAADPARGRFRTFLRAAFAHYLANEWDRERAEKRGGGRLLSIEVEPADPAPPDDAFDREWARVVLRRGLDRLKASVPAIQYELLIESMSESKPHPELQPHDLKNYLFRARQRLREIMLEEISSQVGDPAEAEAELAHLRDCLKPGPAGAS